MPPWRGDLSEEDVLDLLALMRSWQEPSAEPPTPMAAPPALAGNVENGEALYAANCAGCHGGQGEGSYASALKPSAAVEEASDAELQQLIANGRSGMSAFGDRLNDDDILDLVTLMRAWQE
jgi:mono/diheme cytochrome c family protein